MRGEIAIGSTGAAPPAAHIVGPLLGEVELVWHGVRERLEEASPDHGELDTADDGAPFEEVDDVDGQPAPDGFRKGVRELAEARRMIAGRTDPDPVIGAPWRWVHA